ncbi:MAG: restriction endonuclease [Candidatus Bathyarchaeaceae archaeon]
MEEESHLDDLVPTIDAYKGKNNADIEKKKSLGEQVLEVVSLDDMDGFEFERFIAHLFERLGFGKAEEILKTGDAGRDIVIRAPDGELIIVECKHHPGGTIGRPVVQKLHSAVITAQAKKGFLVVTGRFSHAATTYAKGLEPPIELVDSRILYDMAKRAHIRLLKKGEETIVYYILPPSQELVVQKTIEHIIGCALSQPNTPWQLVKTTVTKTLFIPAYLLEYSLHEIFSTTVGIIHRVHVDRKRILLNGQEGEPIDTRLVKLVAPSSMAEKWYPQAQENVSSGSFKLGYSEAKKIGIKHIQKHHTKTVRYYGANNVCYTKTCVPHVSNILVQSLTQVYLPLLTVSCRIVTRQHQLSLCGNQNEVEVLESDAGICEICGKELNHERLLCNSCGRIVHAPSFLMGHSYSCELCGRTICKECAYWTRKYLFLKKKLCESCADKLERERKKVKKLS